MGAFHSTQNTGYFGWYIKWNGPFRFSPTGIFRTSFEGGPHWPVWSFQSVGPKCPLSFDKIVVPSTALLYPAYKNNNQTRGGLDRVCATGMYRFIGHVKFPEIFVEKNRKYCWMESAQRLCFWLNNIKWYFKGWSQQLTNTSDLCGRNLKHSFPALIDCSCSSSLKCASAKAWYAAVNINTSWPELERWMHMLRSKTAFLWLLLSTALRPRCSHCFGWPFKKWWCISVVMAQILDPS